MKSVIIFAAAVGVAVFRPARAQDIEYVSSTLHSGFITSVTVSGDYAYCAVSHLLLTLSVSDPSSPTLINASPGLGGDGAFLFGNYLYFTRIFYSNTRVQMVDISDPANPAEILQFSGFSTDIYVDSSYIYLARDHAGLYIFDNSDLFNPIWISSIHTPGAPGGIDVIGQYVFIADLDSGLTVVNATDPYYPTIFGRYDDPSLGNHQFADISVSGDYAYIADRRVGLRIFDISDPSAPQYCSYLGLPSHPSKIIVNGDMAYTGVGGEGLICLVDVTDPLHPVLTGDYSGETSHKSLFVADSLIYVGGETNYGNQHSRGLLQTVNIVNPENPTLLGEYDVGRRSTACVFVSGNYVYCGDQLFYMVDFSDPASPAPLGHFDMPSTPNDAWARGDYVYVATDHSLMVISYADPNNPLITGQRPVAGSVNNIYLKDNYIYMPGTSGDLSIVDISDPANPEIAGIYHNEEGFSDIDLDGNYAYLTKFDDGIIVLAIRNPVNPEFVGSWDEYSILFKIQVEGSYAYAASLHNLMIFDITDPVSPELVGISNDLNMVGDIAIQGNLAYIGMDSPFELLIYDISDPQAPQVIARRELSGSTRGLAVSGDMIYVAAGNCLAAYRYALTSISDTPILLPVDYLSSENYPNPFNSTTTIRYKLPVASNVAVEVYDILGRKIETLSKGLESAGEHQTVWNAAGQASGIYFYSIRTGNKSDSKRMILLK